MSACDDADCVGSGFERVDFTYDGEGHRTAILATPASGSAVETTFRYGGDAIVAEYVDGTLAREYVTDDAGTISKVIVPVGQTGAGTYLVTWNGHGDAMALWRIESTGALTLANSFTYGTWGEPTTSTHNSITDLGFRFLYVGMWDVQWDADLGLHYMHARHYSPDLGRFLQRDPSRLDTQLFAYAGNSPVSKVDPSGLAWYLRAQVIVDRRDDFRLSMSFGLAMACAPSSFAGAAFCWFLSETTLAGLASWLAGKNYLEVRQAYYSSTGWAKIVYRGALRTSTGRYIFSSDTAGARYSCGSMAVAKACAEVLIGIRNAYNLDWYCGRVRDTWG